MWKISWTTSCNKSTNIIVCSHKICKRVWEKTIFNYLRLNSLSNVTHPGCECTIIDINGGKEPENSLQLNTVVLSLCDVLPNEKPWGMSTVSVNSFDALYLPSSKSSALLWAYLLSWNCVNDSRFFTAYWDWCPLWRLLSHLNLCLVVKKQ